LHLSVQKAKTQRAYGFVHYAPNVSGILSALKCAEDLKDNTIDNVHYKCEVSHKLVKQLIHQQDSEVVKLIHKYYPGGIQELKEKAQIHDQLSQALSIQTSFPEPESSASGTISTKTAAVPLPQVNYNAPPPLVSPLAYCAAPFPPPSPPFHSMMDPSAMYYDQQYSAAAAAATWAWGGGHTTGNYYPQSHSFVPPSNEVITGTETVTYNPIIGMMKSASSMEANRRHHSSDNSQVDSDVNSTSTSTQMFSVRDSSSTASTQHYSPPQVIPWPSTSASPGTDVTFSPTSPAATYYTSFPSPLAFPYMMSYLPYPSPMVFPPAPHAQGFQEGGGYGSYGGYSQYSPPSLKTPSVKNNNHFKAK
jgi:hypothetical protein